MPRQFFRPLEALPDPQQFPVFSALAFCNFPSILICRFIEDEVGRRIVATWRKVYRHPENSLLLLSLSLNRICCATMSAP